MATITDPKEIGGLLRAIADYQGSIVTRCALRLAPLVFVRPGELRQAEWKEIHFDTMDIIRWPVIPDLHWLPLAMTNGQIFFL